MLIAHKTRLHPNNKQISFFKQCSGFSRFAYNWALGEIKREWEDNETRIGTYDADKRFNAHKKESLPWAYDVPSCVGQRAIIADLKSGMDGFFRRVKKGEKAGYPKFKKKGHRDSFELTNSVLKGDRDLLHKHIKLPKKQGLVRLGDPIRFKGKLMSTTISRQGGKWYASFLIKTEEDIEYPMPEQGSMVGIDVGVKQYVTLSTGEMLPPNQELKANMKRLARLQKAASRKKKGSSNWKKQQAKVARLHASIANKRRDYAEKTTTQLANQYETVAIEDLKVSNMSKSAKGNAENHGKNVKQKSGLNRSILDAGFFQFRSMLEYKLERRGGVLIAVDPKNTSRTCPACNHVSADNRKTQDRFKCVECGYTGNADVVAANNIFHRGLKMIERKIGIVI